MAKARAKVQQRFASPSALRRKKKPALGGQYEAENLRKGFGRHAARFGRQQAALNRKGILRAEKDEQTPFGTVTFVDAGAETYDAGNGVTAKVQFIKSSAKNFEGSDPDINYEVYTDLAAHLAASPRLARMLLIELLETTIANSGDDPESISARKLRCVERQAYYQDEDPTSLRVMAMLYSLFTFSEEQRTAGGKTIRGALQEIIAGEMGAIEAFAGTFTPEGQAAVEGNEKKQIARLKRNWPLFYEAEPIVVQLGKGGLEMFRLYSRGGKLHEQAHDDLEAAMSMDSDDENAEDSRKWVQKTLIEDHNAEERKRRGVPKHELTILDSDFVDIEQPKTSKELRAIAAQAPPPPPGARKRRAEDEMPEEFQSSRKKHTSSGIRERFPFAAPGEMLAVMEELTGIGWHRPDRDAAAIRRGQGT